MRFLIQIVINAIALYVSASLAPGAFAPTNMWDLLVVAFVYGLLNAIVRPILTILTCPAYVLTLGLFTFVMNVFILWMLQRITGAIVWGDFWQTMVAGLIVSIVSWVLNLFLYGKNDR
jgi:putative membrane protein